MSTGRERLERALGYPVQLSCLTENRPGSAHVWTGADVVVKITHTSGRSYTYEQTAKDGHKLRGTVATGAGTLAGLRGCLSALRKLTLRPPEGWVPVRVVF